MSSQVASDPSVAATVDPAAIKAEQGHVPKPADAPFDIHVAFSDSSRINRERAAHELCDLVKLEGPQAFTRLGLADAIEKGLKDKKNTAAREGACELIAMLVEQGVGNSVEPFVYEKVLPLLVGEAFADKIVSVREAAVQSVKALVQVATPWATSLMLPTLLLQIKTAGKWQVKTGALSVIDQLVISAPEPMAHAMPDIIPVMVRRLWTRGN